MVTTEKSAILNINREKLYEINRDHLEKFSKYIEGVKSVDLISKEENNNKYNIHRKWDISDKLPDMISYVLPEGTLDTILIYDDIAVWDNDNFTSEYTITPSGSLKLYKITGKTFFEKLDDDKCKIVLKLDLQLDLSSIPISSLLLEPLRNTISNIFIEKISNSMYETTKKLTEVLETNDNII